MDLAYGTFLAFTIFNSLRLVSYLPQIMRIARDQNGASAISYSTWTLWTAANTSTAAYAAVNLGDAYLSLVSAISAACCFIVISLTMFKRRRLPTTKPQTAKTSDGEDRRWAVMQEVERAGRDLAQGRSLWGVRDTRLRGLAWRFVCCEIAMCWRGR